MECAALANGELIEHPAGSLRSQAQALCLKGAGGDVPAITQVADRLDGKPAQESMVTIDHKRDASDWARHELVAFLDDATAGRKGTPAAN